MGQKIVRVFQEHCCSVRGCPPGHTSNITAYLIALRRLGPDHWLSCFQPALCQRGKESLKRLKGAVPITPKVERGPYPDLTGEVDSHGLPLRSRLRGPSDLVSLQSGVLNDVLMEHLMQRHHLDKGLLRNL